MILFEIHFLLYFQQCSTPDTSVAVFTERSVTFGPSITSINGVICLIVRSGLPKEEHLTTI